MVSHLSLSHLRRWFLPLATLLIALFGVPGPRLPYSTGRWIIFGFVALLGLALCTVSLPALKRWWWLALTLLAGFFLVHQFWLVGWGLQMVVADRMAFWLLFFLSWQAFRVHGLEWSDFFWPLGIALFVVSGWGHFQLLEYFQTSSGSDHYVAVSSLYGYANNGGQFTVLALALFWFLPKPTYGGASFFRWLVGISSLLFLGATLNRSAWIAFALSMGLGYSLLWLGRKKKFFLSEGFGKRALVGFSLGALIVGGALFVFSQELATAWSKKPQLTSWRIQIWQEASQLLRDHPLGVGAGQYTFSVVPYRKNQTQSETHVTHNPHNEWVRYLVEDGPFLSLALFGIWGALLLMWWRRRGPEAPIIGSFFGALLAEFTVQFPIFNPMGSWFLALVGGSLLAKCIGSWEPDPPRRSILMAARVGLAGLFLLFFTPASFARLQERSNDPDLAKASCQWVPTNYEVCLWAAELLLNQQRYEEARELLKMTLQRQPHNWLAIRALAVVGWRDGDRLEACYYMWRYLHYFSDQPSEIKQTIVQQCPPHWIRYFNRKKPPEYRGGWKDGKEKAKQRLLEGQLHPLNPTDR